MVSGVFPRLVASGAKGLALIAAVQRAEATSSIGDDAINCSDAFLACADDNIRWGCITEHDETQHNGSVDATYNADAVSDSGLSTTCNFETVPCCLNEAVSQSGDKQRRPIVLPPIYRVQRRQHLCGRKQQRSPQQQNAFEICLSLRPRSFAAANFFRG
eukprot:jgi/Undpi1/2337/HiC_scaffold_13.g05720.m1